MGRPRTERRRKVVRALELTALTLVLAGIAAALIFGNWVAAQARTVVVLSTTNHTPALTWAVKVVTDEPRAEETTIAGAPTTVVRPGGGKRWPAVLFVNGATRAGRHHPDVQRFARGLARAGYVAFVPDLPGLRLGEIADRTVAAVVSVAQAVAARPDVRSRQVSLLGVSVGTTLALLAAERPALAGKLRLVAGVAPYTSLRKVIRMSTTGTYAAGTTVIRYPADPYVGLAVARSLAVALPPGHDRGALREELEAVDDDDPDPLGGLRRSPPALRSPSGRAVAGLLANRDPRRFEILYARLPPRARAAIVRLSPLAAARRLEAPVLLASAPHDDYFPPQESRALAAAAQGTEVSVTTTTALSHVLPDPSLGSIGDLVRFDGFAVRVLERAWA
jgi:dienelactone hydrolase